MRIIELRPSGVTVEDDQGYRYEVTRVMEFTICGAQDGRVGVGFAASGKWRCTCCNRVRCVHARFVQTQNPILPAEPPVNWERYADLLEN